MIPARRRRDRRRHRAAAGQVEREHLLAVVVGAVQDVRLVPEVVGADGHVRPPGGCDALTPRPVESMAIAAAAQIDR